MFKGDLSRTVLTQNATQNQTTKGLDLALDAQWLYINIYYIYININIYYIYIIKRKIKSRLNVLFCHT